MTKNCLKLGIALLAAVLFGGCQNAKPTLSLAPESANLSSQPLHVILSPTNYAAFQESRLMPTCDVQWTQAGLLVNVALYDATPYEAEELPNLYQGDCVELFLADGHDPRQYFQVMIAPGQDGRHTEPRQYFVDHRTKVKTPLKAEVTVTSGEKGARHLKVLLPWENLGLTGAADKVRLQVVVDDGQAGGTLHRYFWYPALDSFANPQSTVQLYHPLHSMPTEPQAPDLIGISADVRSIKQTVVMVTTPTSYIGQPIKIYAGRQADHPWGTATIQSSQAKFVNPKNAPEAPAQGYAEIRIPTDDVIAYQNNHAAQVGNEFLFLQIGKQPPLVLQSGAGQWPFFPKGSPTLKAEIFSQTELRFKNGPGGNNELSGSVFSGSAFPQPYFADPVGVEDFIGPFFLQAEYYNANHQLVTTATQPGRYGAVVTIRNQSGQTWRRYYTLFRSASPITNLRNLKIPVSGPMPAEMGLDPQVVAEQKSLIGDSYTSFLIDSARKDNRIAVLLAALWEAKPGEPTGVDRLSANARDAQWWFPLQQQYGEPLYPYGVINPTDLNDPAHAGQKWPLIIYLHGSGGRGKDLKLINTTSWDAPFFMQQMKHNPFLIIYPQCPPNESWNVPELNAFLDMIIAKYPVDLDRIYVTGMSMGGYGTWNWCQASPERFAAVAPVCGDGDTNDVERIKNVPIWIFHGDADPTVPIQGDSDCFAALQAVKARARFTIYPGGGHNAAAPTYSDPRIYQWLLEQKRNAPSEPVGGTGGAATMPASDWNMHK